MKRVMCLLLVSLVPLVLAQTQTTVVVIDEYHTMLGIKERFNLVTSTLAGGGYDVGFNYGELTSDLLERTDILVIAIPTERISDAERAAILNFVMTGGGLFLVGESKSFSDDYGILDPLNQLAVPFGIRFNEDVVVDEERGLVLKDQTIAEIPVVSDTISHPVTLGVNQFFIQYGCSLTISPPATKLAFGSGSSYSDKNDNQKQDYDEMSAPVVLAVSEYGDGRIVAIGDSHLWGSRETSALGYVKDQIEYLDNKRLVKNIFFWLSSKPAIRSVVGLIGEARQMQESDNYIGAKQKLTFALTTLARIGSQQHIAEINDLLESAEEGIRADALMASAERALAAREYDRARQDFEAARAAYSKIGSPKEQSASERISSLDKMTEKDRKKIEADTLFDKGLSEFNKGNCTTALDYFRKAKTLYGEARDIQKANLCTEYIEKCTKEETGLTAFGFLSCLLVLWRTYRNF